MLCSSLCTSKLPCEKVFIGKNELKKYFTSSSVLSKLTCDKSRISGLVLGLTKTKLEVAGRVGAMHACCVRLQRSHGIPPSHLACQRGQTVDGQNTRLDLSLGTGSASFSSSLTTIIRPNAR
jgi:hypothetical protein